MAYISTGVGGVAGLADEAGRGESFSMTQTKQPWDWGIVDLVLLGLALLGFLTMELWLPHYGGH